ncbi:MAG: hypothetical protein AB1425_11685 [Actinomycetota bacterium]
MPENVPPARRPDNHGPTSPEERRRLLRAAALRPLNVLMLVIGGVFFAATLAWWLPPLTLITYTALVILAYRDPIFSARALGRPQATPDPPQDLSPERRARWLPRGETRARVEEALLNYRKVVAAIEQSDDVTRAVLEGALPRLHTAADRLVDLALAREKASGMAGELHRKGNPQDEGTLRELEDEVRAADAQISSLSEELLSLRAQVVRVSIGDSAAGREAASLNSSLDDLNLRLEALRETMSSPENHAH